MLTSAAASTNPPPAVSHVAAPAHGLTADEVRRLSQACVDAKSRAYCPYSSFRVGAALLIRPTPSSSTDNTTTAATDADTAPIIAGANVENAAYPSGTCAERVAVNTAVVAGHGRTLGELRALAVATDAPEPSSPCGMCRQVLREFCELSMPIFMHDREGRYVVKTLGELLPMSFGPSSLPSPQELQRSRRDAKE